MFRELRCCVVAEVGFQEIFVEQRIVQTAKEAHLTFPVEVTAGGLSAVGLVPRWVDNVGEVGDLRPAVVRFPFNDVGTEEHLQVVVFVDLPVVVGGDVPSLTLGVGHFATNMVGVTTI